MITVTTAKKHKIKYYGKIEVGWSLRMDNILIMVKADKVIDITGLDSAVCDYYYPHDVVLIEGSDEEC